MVDVKKAFLNPAAVFKGPEEIVSNDELTRDQKIEILGRWEYDIRQLQVADGHSAWAESSHDRAGDWTAL